MDQLYPIAGTTTTSCASQDFDFLNYWVDQSVEKEIRRGKKLRELKTRPAVRKEKYDVINIGNTNVYSEKKKCRSRSPKKSRKGRRNSPKRKGSPIRKFTKKDSSKSSRQRCPMRIAELSVPSKRQCIDTWRTKYHVLPGIMIDRLREHVMDLSPVVKIPDAIECFKLHKNAEKRRNKEAQEKKLKRDIKKSDCKDNIKKKPTKVQECRFLCTIFGHKIAKALNKPVQVTLNTELLKISNVVSFEIEKLINKGKRTDNKNIKNKKVHAEVAGKISIWIASILEETEYKILEDQLRDLEEEAGPVLDLIDDLVDNVVDFCEPEPEVIEVFSSSDTYNVESSTEYEGQEENISADNISVEIDFPPETEPIIENLDDFIKNALDKIINSFDGDILSEVDYITDIEDRKIQDYTEFENIADKEQSEFLDANDTFDGNLNEAEPQADSDILQDSFQSKEDPSINDQGRESDPDIKDNSQSKEDPSINEQGRETDPDKEDSSQSKEDPSINDQGRETDPDKDIGNDIISEDDSNKKVKFSDINMVTSDGTTEEGAQIISEYLNPDQAFNAFNNHLFSDIDEPWPEDMTLPILRPSESVSKSITSLGRIMELEERMSVMLDDDTNINTKEIINYKTGDAKQLNETKESITDANENIEQRDVSVEVLNDISMDIDDQAKINETANITADSNLTDFMQQNEIATYINIGTKSHEMEEDPDGKTFTKDLESQNERVERYDEYIGKDGTAYAKEQGIEYDGVQRYDEYIDKDGTAYAKEQGIDYDGTDGTDKHVGIDGKKYSQEQKTETGRPGRTDEYTGEDGTTSTKEQAIDKGNREKQTDFIGKDAQIMQETNLTADDGIHRPSTDSIFNHDVPTATIAYEQKLDKILEEQATQVEATLDKQLEDETTQVKYEKILEDGATQITTKTKDKKQDFETADKEINTSFSLVSRADKSTSIASQSLGDIAKLLQDVKADNMFSSLRIKPKVDYKVHKNSAPSWVTQNYGEPSDSFYTIPPKQQKGANDKNIRLWCKDLENGFYNLELWNGWIENTLESVKITEMKKARICIDKSRDDFVRDWLHLKKNVDADVLTWTKLSKSTQEKLKGFRKIYQNFEKLPPQHNKFCNCYNTTDLTNYGPIKDLEQIN